MQEMQTDICDVLLLLSSPFELSYYSTITLKILRDVRKSKATIPWAEIRREELFSAHAGNQGTISDTQTPIQVIHFHLLV